MELSFFLSQMQGPLGALALAMLIVVTLVATVKMLFDFAWNVAKERIEKIENALKHCEDQHESARKENSGLRENVGELRGRLEELKNFLSRENKN